jgi:two-component system response regulator YesN
MRKMSGNALMRRVKEAGNDCEFIILTDTYSHDALQDFFLDGGFEYLLKPLDVEKAETMLEKLACRLASGAGPGCTGRQANTKEAYSK